MRAYDEMDRNAYVALGAVVGTIAGIGLGLLMAPRSGAETRQHLRKKALLARRGAMERMWHKRDMAMQSLSKSLDKSRTLIDTAVDRAKDTADKMSERAKDAATRAQQETDTARTRRGER